MIAHLESFVLNGVMAGRGMRAVQLRLDRWKEWRAMHAHMLQCFVWLLSCDIDLHRMSCSPEVLPCRLPQASACSWVPMPMRDWICCLTKITRARTWRFKLPSRLYFPCFHLPYTLCACSVLQLVRILCSLYGLDLTSIGDVAASTSAHAARDSSCATLAPCRGTTYTRTC